MSTALRALVADNERLRAELVQLRGLLVPRVREPSAWGLSSQERRALTARLLQRANALDARARVDTDANRHISAIANIKAAKKLRAEARRLLREIPEILRICIAPQPPREKRRKPASAREKSLHERLVRLAAENARLREALAQEAAE
ncbi:hypothetical protein ACT6QH_02055 [Xanthobacter sp. TB0139]|uniref:hypothetical protein n=1 Tax=Xanthobacter sp. TB0139 TaxID=3459178 RepID=UPI004039F480